MNIEVIKEQAFNDHCSGFNCAESVCRAILQHWGSDLDPSLARAATAFGGGMGRSFQETCGSLTGGLVALGLLFGRDRTDVDWNYPAELAAAFRTEFIEAFGSAKCQTILDAFGPQENDMKCKHLSGEAAGILARLLNEKIESACSTSQASHCNR